jgi:hypothetical protein
VIAASELRDRVDIIERNTSVKDQRADTETPVPLARNVPCAITRVGDRGAALAALLGFPVIPKLSCIMNHRDGVLLRPGWQLQRTGHSRVYSINSVDLYPNDDRPEFMVADITEDSSREDAA